MDPLAVRGVFSGPKQLGLISMRVSHHIETREMYQRRVEELEQGPWIFVPISTTKLLQFSPVSGSVVYAGNHMWSLHCATYGAMKGYSTVLVRNKKGVPCMDHYLRVIVAVRDPEQPEKVLMRHALRPQLLRIPTEQLQYATYNPSLPPHVW